MTNNNDFNSRLAAEEEWKSRYNLKTFDPIQETHEEYLRRIHLDDRLNNNEWKYDKQKIISFKKAIEAAAKAAEDNS